MTSTDNDITFIMPSYNEAEIIENKLVQFIEFANTLEHNYELIVVENGSTDDTLKILNRLRSSFGPLKVIRNDSSNFGKAFKLGVNASKNNVNILLHVDHWDTEFIQSALNHLKDFPLVQASKNLPGSTDRRPFLRKVLTHLYNRLLRVIFGFNGSDTTGLKAFRKDIIGPVLKSCKLEREMLETELVLRCNSRGIPIKEVPVTIYEKRPQRDPLMRKIWINAVDLLTLTYIFYWND
jgi:glycosyltransferase involved in cell wall biosynthesis